MKLDYYYSSLEELKNHLLENSKQLNKTGGLNEAVEIIKSKIDNGKRIHICGAGRSMEVGMIFGKYLKKNGLSELDENSDAKMPLVYFLRKTRAKPIRKDELIIAISGSGGTPDTIDQIEYMKEKKRGAEVLGITSHLDSRIAELSDYTVRVIGKTKEEKSFWKSRITGDYSPLTVLGTQFELATFLTLQSLANQIYGKTNLEELTSRFDEYITKTMELKQNNISNLLNDLYDERFNYFTNDFPNKVFVVGEGINHFVARMFAMRLEHTGIESALDYSWEERRPGDTLIAITGSGHTKSVYELLGDSIDKKNSMNVGVITCFPKSRCGRLGAENTVQVFGRQSDESVHDVPYYLRNAEISLSELVSACALDSMVTQINNDLRRIDPGKAHADN